MILNVLGFVSAPLPVGGKMAKTTMKAGGARVEGAISGTGATGSSKRPFQRLVMAFWPAVPLYPYGRRRTPAKKW